MTPMPLSPPALYVGRIKHTRYSDPRHHFTQPIAMHLLDIRAVDRLARRLRLFSHNAFNLSAYFERDHGPRDGSDLLDWVQTRLRETHRPPADGPVYLLAQPRILGYVFNPVSIYFCHDADHVLRTLIYQVHNTYGEAHAYIRDVCGTAGHITQKADKSFRVSPFLPMRASYDFRMRISGETINLIIGVRNEGKSPLFTARLDCRRRPFTDWNLLQGFLTRPLLPQRAHLAIFRQAGVIWLKSRTGSAPQGKTR